jgi:NADH:ubiquinone oxidoreductase subunit 3 (subunit A)
LPIADRNVVIKLLPGAEITIYMLLDKNWLQRRKAEYYTCGEKAVDHSQTDLD